MIETVSNSGKKQRRSKAYLEKSLATHSHFQLNKIFQTQKKAVITKQKATMPKKT